MKGKRFLAGILSVVLILGTMVIPAFAEGDVTNVEDFSEFRTAVANNAEYIKFTKNITCDDTQVSGMIISIDYNCTIDLNGFTLSTGNNSGSVYTTADVKITGGNNKRGAVTFSNPSTDVFRCYKGTMTLENIDFSGHSCCYVISCDYEASYAADEKNIVINNCSFKNITSEVDREVNVLANNGNAVFYLTDTEIDAGIGRALYASQSCSVKDFYLSGRTIINSTKGCKGEFYTIGNEVQFNGTATAMKATVTTAAGGVSYYKTLAEAIENSQMTDTVTLLEDCELERVLLKCGTIDLNDKKLTLTGQDYRTANNVKVTFKDGIIEANDVDVRTFGLLTVFGDGMTLDNVKFYVDGLTCVSGTYLFYVSDGGEFKAVNGTKFDIRNCNDETVFANNGGTILLDGADVYIDGAGKAFLHSASFNNSKVEIYNVENGFTNGSDYTKYVLTGTTVIIDNCTYGVMLYENTGFELEASADRQSSITVTNATEGIWLDAAGAYVKCDATSAIDAGTNAEAKVGGVYYKTFAEAVANAADGDTITLLKSTKGDGIAVYADTFATNGLTIDLNGKTYTVDGNLQGSTGSKSNGFYIEKGNKLTIKNGKLTSSKDATYTSENPQTLGAVYNTGILLQNHSESLTLENVTLDGTNLRDEIFSYTLGNDNGAVTIINSKIIANTDGTNAYAFDADNSGSSYDFRGVTIDAGSIVNGYMQITSGGPIILGGVTYSADGYYYKDGDKLVGVTAAQMERCIKAEASKTEVKAGEEFDVKVVLDAQDIATAGYTLSYDTSIFELVSDTEDNDGEIIFFDNAGGLADTYAEGAELATYKFKAIAQTAETTGSFNLSNTRATTYEENRTGTTFEVSKQDAEVRVKLAVFDAKVKLDGKEVSGTSAAINYDGKKHSVAIDVQPKQYKEIEKTYKFNGSVVNREPDFKEPGTYEVSYNVVAHNGYAECRGTFTLTILEANAYYVEVDTSKATKTSDYVAGKKLVLVYTDLKDVAFKYDGKDMIEVTKTIGNYQYNGDETTKTNFSHVYAYVAGKTTENTFASYKANITPFIIDEDYTIEKLDEYTCDINDKKGMDEQDPGTAIGVYGVYGGYYGNPDAQRNILKADVNGDKRVTPEDVKEVTLAAFGK